MILVYWFHKGLNVNTTANFIQRCSGVDALIERWCRRWFSRFKIAKFRLDGELSVPGKQHMDYEYF